MQESVINVSETSTMVPAEEDHPLRDLLQLELQAKTQWTKQEIWPEPIAGPQRIWKLRKQPQARWRIVGIEQIQEHLLDAEQSQAPANLISKTHSSFSILSQLAEGESLAGWNACLLLAWQQPQLMTDRHIKKLQKLVLDPPQYNSLTGKKWERPISLTTLPDKPSSTSSDLLQKIHRLKFWQKDSSAEVDSTESDADSAAQMETSPSDEDSNHSSTSTNSPDQPVARSITKEMRAAAAEAWCYVLSRQTGEPESLLADAGIALEEAELPVIVKAELIRGIGRSIPPRKIPHIPQQLQKGVNETETSEMTLACLEACLLYGLHHSDTISSMSTEGIQGRTFDYASLDPNQLWPKEIWDYRWVDRIEIVRRFGLWLAITKHPLAESYLKELLQHLEPQLQWEAVRNLGLIKNQERKTELLNWAETRPGMPRAIAILAAAEDDPELIYNYQDDESPIVRSRVAEYAGQRPSLRTQQILRKLIVDEAPVVQEATLNAISDWNSDLSMPVLAEGFVSGTTATRRHSRLQLEKQLEIVLVSVEDTPADRQKLVNSLLKNRKLGSSAVPATIAQPQHNRFSQSGSLSVSELNEFQSKVSQRLQPDLSLSLQRQLDQEIQSRIQSDQGILHQDLNGQSGTELQSRISLYARLGSEYCLLIKRLQSTDVFARRDAVRKLVLHSEKQTLPEWIVHVMAEQMGQEQDVHVCRDLMQAISHDTTPAARRVVEAALVHRWPDVRILGCEYISQHQLPQLAPFLLPLLHSRNPAVQQAAIQSAGRSRNPLVIDGYRESSSDSGQINSAQTGLRSLLGTSSAETEFLVIQSLAELGDEQGINELRKLCYSTSTDFRSQAISKLTQIQDSHTPALLIQLAWTEKNPRIRQLILESLTEVIPETQQPVLDERMSESEQIAAWSAWLEEKR